MQTNNPCELLTAAMPVGSGDLLGDTAFIGYVVCMISGCLGACLVGAYYDPIERWRASLNARLCSCAAWFRSSIEFLCSRVVKCPIMDRSAAMRSASALASLSERSRSNRSKNSNCRSSIFFWKRSWRQSNHHCNNAANPAPSTAANKSLDASDQSTTHVANNVINVVSPNEKS